MNKPNGDDLEGLVKYDETASGCFVHSSAPEAAGGINVWFSVSTDWSGRQLEPPTVVIGDRELTVPQALAHIDLMRSAVERIGLLR
jgi:hypothetical protein